ncbi:MAG: patatin [Sphaerospermopsis sp. SIO1G1]|nr:patatin [Sphaerospermopsis sp. SIO1G1]
MANKLIEQFVITFDGQDDYIDFGRKDVSGALSHDSKTFTVSGWINPHELSSNATTYGTRNVFFSRSSDRYSDNFEFGINEIGNLDIYIDEKIIKYVKTLGNRDLVINQWNFFAIIFNQGELTVYINQNEYLEFYRGTSLNKATSPITLGATLHNNVYFKGQLAHVSVWNCACDQEKIGMLRSGNITGNEEGLVAYWKLDEGGGKTVKNLVGNSYQGNLQGNPNWELTQIPFIGETLDASEQKTGNIASSNADISDTTATVFAQTSDDSNQQEDQNLQIQAKVNEQNQDNIQKPAKSKYKILAIDGGGIRGIIPAMLLAEIEKRTQKPIYSLFDVIAGTSSGGILALGLTKPKSRLLDNSSHAEYTAEDLVCLFVEHGVEIFYDPFFERLLKPIEDVLFQPKYISTSKEDILTQYFGNSLLENNLKEVFVTTYDIEQRIPIFLTNKLEKQQIQSKRFRNLCAGFSLIDAALATSATPTYFPPHRIATTHNNNGFYTLVDGGVFANNPAQLAISEAQLSSQQQGNGILNPEDILLVSLGTGSLTKVYPYDEVKNWGLLQWSRPLLSMMLDGGNEVVAGELERLFAANKQKVKKSYYRFQPLLNAELEEIDNTTLKNTRYLQTISKQIIANYSQTIDNLCHLLLE